MGTDEKKMTPVQKALWDSPPGRGHLWLAAISSLLDEAVFFVQHSPLSAQDRMEIGRPILDHSRFIKKRFVDMAKEWEAQNPKGDQSDGNKV